MKRAVLYARVSSELQKKERTVDSQVLELKKQIAHDGNILVKEYVDEGYSGAQLDRPAMDELRNDLKKDVFDSIYVLNTDRIAREVTYQTIIIAEILKHRKQVIINGVDYIHNPENKFTLTVLGAVAELERAKITERSTRGKALKLAQGLLTGGGHNMFGYDYVHKTPTTEAHFVINEREANIVRTIFHEFTTTSVSLPMLAKKIKEAGHLTKTGTTNWNGANVGLILRNFVYTGTMYLNKAQVTTEYANPMYGTVKTSKKVVYRDKSEWVGIPIPPIISKELFEKTKEHITKVVRVSNRKIRTELLSNLLICGSCNGEYYAQKRKSAKYLRRDPNNVYMFIQYMCRKRIERKEPRCPTKQIISHIAEDKVWDMFNTVITHPEILKTKTSASSKAVEKYCEAVCTDYKTCIDFETKRTFLLKYVTKVVYSKDDSLILYGSIGKLEYKIEATVTEEDRQRKRMSAMGAITKLVRKKMREGLEGGRTFSVSQGILSGGFTLFGYDYIHKTPTSKGKLVINEHEANMVRTAFNIYSTKKDVGLGQIARNFEKADYLTKYGRKYWYVSAIRSMLRNPAYTGTMYFNKTKRLAKNTKETPREKSEWVGLPIPPIVPKEVFETVQKRLESNKEKYTSNVTQYLLSNLITCSVCGGKYGGFRACYKRPLTRDPNNICNITYYLCTKKKEQKNHKLNDGVIQCTNKQVTSTLLEEKVWDIVTTDLIEPDTLRIKIKEPEQIPPSTVDFSIRKFCYNLQMELEECKTFETKRNLLLSCIDKITYNDGTVILYGFIPVEKSNTCKIEYRIKRNITTEDRHRKRLQFYRK